MLRLDSNQSADQTRQMLVSSMQNISQRGSNTNQAGNNQLIDIQKVSSTTSDPEQRLNLLLS